MIARYVAIAVALSCAAGPALADNPKVPPEPDPGGVPVALIGGGVDYTRPEIAKRLARDGEGNIVGWDFVDDDIHPFTRDAQANSEADEMLSIAGVELVPIRAQPDDIEAVAKAAAFLSRTDVRTVVILPSGDKPEPWQLFVRAATHLKDMLFVVPYRAAPGASSAPTYPAALGLPNVLSVAVAAETDAVADVAFASREGAGEPATPNAAAIVAAASLATCHAAQLGAGDGAARKAAVIAKLAKPRSVSKVPVIEPCG